MLAGVRLAPPYSYLNQADRLTNDWSVRNSPNSEYIDASYRDTLEDTYALIADKMSSPEQYVRFRNSFKSRRMGLDSGRHD
jgi:hypothetical protein